MHTTPFYKVKLTQILSIIEGRKGRGGKEREGEGRGWKGREGEGRKEEMYKVDMIRLTYFVIFLSFFTSSLNLISF